jgi:hypothetical protein
VKKNRKFGKHHGIHYMLGKISHLFIGYMDFSGVDLAKSTEVDLNFTFSKKSRTESKTAYVSSILLNLPKSIQPDSAT